MVKVNKNIIILNYEFLKQYIWILEQNDSTPTEH